MKEDYYKTLYKGVVTQVPDGGGGFTTTTADTAFEGYIGMLNGSEINKNQSIGNSGTARLLTSDVLSKTNRIVDTAGYFSEAGTVFEVAWCYQNPHEGNFYDLKIV
jgi:hypothetical protein